MTNLHVHVQPEIYLQMPILSSVSLTSVFCVDRYEPDLFLFSVMVDMNQADYALHLESCKARQPCEICGQLLKNRHMARHKLLKHHAIRTFHCDVCPYIAKNKTTLRMHLQAHKGKVIVVPKSC
jgi:uncharacterized protein YlaI